MTADALIALAPYILSAGTSYSIAIYCWRHRTTAGASAYAVVALTWALWTTGSIFKLAAPTLAGKIFWDDLEFYPSFVTPIALLTFSLRYTNTNLRHARLVWGMLWAIAIGFSLLVLTNPLQHLMRNAASLVPGHPFDALVYDFTPLDLNYTFYFYGVALFAIILLAMRWFRVSAPYRGQIAVILIGQAVPYIGTGLTVFGVIHVLQRDTSPFWFTLSNVMVWWGLYRYRLFNLAPIAREKLIEQMSDAVIVLSADNRVVDVNKAAQIATGRPAKELIGKLALDAFPERASLIERLQGIDQLHTEIEVPRGGKVVVYDLQVTPLYDDRQKLLGRLVVIHDITQLKQIQSELSAQRAQLETVVAERTAELIKANQKLQQEIAEREQIARNLSERDERLQRLAEAAFEGIAISENGVFVEANRQMADMLGVTQEELIGQPITNFIAPESRADVERRIKMDEESAYDHTALKKDGTTFPVEVRSRIISVGERKLRMTAVRDMTEQRRAEQSIMESEERFRLILENMPILLDAFDEHDNVIVWNKACEEATGYTAGEMIGNPRAMEILYPDADYRAHVRQASLDPNSHESTFDLIAKNGETRTIEWFDIYHHLPVPGWASWGLGLDVTERKRAEGALRNSEARYRAIVEDQTELVARWKPDGTCTYANAAYCRYFQLADDTVVGASIFPLFTEEALRALRGQLDVLTPEDPVSTSIYPVIKQDGSRGWQEWTDRALFDEQRQLIEIQSVGRDVSQRVFAEEAEREQRSINEALVETSTLLNSTLSQKEVLNLILNNLDRVLKHDAANIMLLEGDTARVVGKRGYSRWGLDEAIEQMSFPVKERNNLLTMMRTLKPAVVPDTSKDPQWVITPEFSWVRSYAGAPIQVKGEVIGFLNLASPTPGFFDAAVLPRLTVFANQVAIAIHNARLYESERQERSINEALVESSTLLNSTLSQKEVLSSILNNLEPVLKHDAANVMLLEGDTARVVGKRGYSRWGLDEVIEHLRFPVKERNNLLTMMRTLQPVVVPDTFADPKWVVIPEFSWLRSYAGAPIQVEGEVIGFLNLDSTTPGFFDAADLQPLSVFANQVAIAIHNARLYESERQERRLAETLEHTASTLLRTLNARDTLTVVMDQLAQVVEYDQAMLLSVEESALRVKADRGLPDVDDRVESTYDYAGRQAIRDLLASGEPLILGDVRQQADAADYPGVAPETRSWMAIPLLAWSIVTGLLTVGSNKVDAFDADAARAAVAFAQQAAIAIQNVLTLSELSKTVNRLREAQARLSGAARLAAAGEIAAGVAHQLNNPLTAVIAEVSLLLKHLSPDDPDYESALNIRAAAEKAASIVQRQLNLSKSIPYDMVETDTNKSVVEALSLVRAQIEPSARLLADLAPDLPQIMASPEHLSDVWLNLLLNARDGVARTPNAVIRVRTSIDPERKGVMVAVEDNGEGIPRDHLEHIFDPFFTTRSGGHGLGLPVCYEVVRRHNGTIQVDSREGSGTTISVVLPFPPRAPAPSSPRTKKVRQHARVNRRR